MTGEQDFESLTRLKEISTLAPALALLAAGLTSSVWLGYRFVLDRRWKRRNPPGPERNIPQPPAEADDELARTAPAPDATPQAAIAAPRGATALRETTPQQPAPTSCAGVSLQSLPDRGRRAVATPHPDGLRPVRSHRTIAANAGRTKHVERRTNVRRGGMTVPVRVTTGGLRLDEMDGTVVDRSQGGLCLDLPGPVQVGQVFRLRSLLYDDVTPWVEVEARSVRPGGAGWVVGCRFASPLPWGLLLLFG